MTRVTDESDESEVTAPGESEGEATTPSEDAASPWERRDETFRDAVRRGYDHLAPIYADRRSPDPDERALLDEFAGRLPAGARVLDAGCGDGQAATTPLVDRGCDVVGLDVSRSQLELAARETSTARLVQGDLVTLPLDDDAVDGVCALHSVIHVPRERHAAVFAEFARVVRPGGHLLVTVGVEGWEGTNEDWFDGGASMGWSFYGAERSRELIEAADFDVRDERIVGDDLGGGSWCYLLARR